MLDTFEAGEVHRGGIRIGEETTGNPERSFERERFRRRRRHFGDVPTARPFPYRSRFISIR